MIEGGGLGACGCVDDEEFVAAAVPVAGCLVDGCSGAGEGGQAGFFCKAKRAVVVGSGALGLGEEAGEKKRD